MSATILLSANPGRLTESGPEIAFAVDGRIPHRRAEVTDLLSVIGVIAVFGRDVQEANPGASFEVSARVIEGSKPDGFDEARKTDALGGRAFLRSDVDESALRQRLRDPAEAFLPQG